MRVVKLRPWRARLLASLGRCQGFISRFLAGVPGPVVFHRVTNMESSRVEALEAENSALRASLLKCQAEVERLTAALQRALAGNGSAVPGLSSGGSCTIKPDNAGGLPGRTASGGQDAAEGGKEGETSDSSKRHAPRGQQGEATEACGNWYVIGALG